MLTAGPGVTNGISGLTSAYFNGAPVIVRRRAGAAVPLGRGQPAGDRPRADRRAITKNAATVTATDDLGRAVRDAALTALTPHRGPVFLDLPLDVMFSTGVAELPQRVASTPIEPDPEDVAEAAALLAAAQRPVLIAGSDVYAGDAVARASGGRGGAADPGLHQRHGPGQPAAEHPLAFTKARRAALRAPT